MSPRPPRKRSKHSLPSRIHQPSKRWRAVAGCIGNPKKEAANSTRAVCPRTSHPRHDQAVLPCEEWYWFPFRGYRRTVARHNPRLGGTGAPGAEGRGAGLSSSRGGAPRPWRTASSRGLVWAFRSSWKVQYGCRCCFEAGSWRMPERVSEGTGGRGRGATGWRW